MHEWETITEYVTRFRVPGGWIYQFLHPVRSSAYVFVPHQELPPAKDAGPCFL